jgi:hypothetical protein
LLQAVLEHKFFILSVVTGQNPWNLQNLLLQKFISRGESGTGLTRYLKNKIKSAIENKGNARKLVFN